MNAKLKSTVLAAGALLAIAPAADAATTFGSRLNHNPANAGDCTQGDLTGPCTIASFIHPSDPNGDPYSGGAPVDGVITKFRTRIFGEGGAAATITLKLAEVSRPDPNSDDTAVARLVGTGPTVTVPATGDMQETPIREFAAQLPVKKGQHLALEGTNLWATYNTSGDQFSYVYSPPLLAGPARTSDIGTGELLVQAVIEPDADGDGLGDETQDKNVVPITLRLQKGEAGPQGRRQVRERHEEEPLEEALRPLRDAQGQRAGLRRRCPRPHPAVEELRRQEAQRGALPPRRQERRRDEEGQVPHRGVA